MTERIRDEDTTDEESDPDIEPEADTTEADDTPNDHEAIQNEECPDCGGRLRKSDDGNEFVCTDCGLVPDLPNIDHGPDWRSFSDDRKDKKSRIGSPITQMMHDKGLSTRISWKDQDAYGQSIPEAKRRRLSRLRTWNQRTATRDSKERNLKQALGEIERMASALGLPKKTRETSGVLYRRCLEEDLLRGRSIEGVSTACLYAAARQTQCPRSFEKFSTVSRVDNLEIKRTYRYIVRELNLPIEPTAPREYLPQFCSNLGVSQTVEKQAMDILETTEENNVRTGKNPIGIAAAAIYAACLLCGADYTQDDISDVTDISVVTIRNRYQELLEAYGAEFTTAEDADEDEE